ncbi:MAG: hypothetical protein QNK19_11275 [Xanthomonadales bacterium]|uniref:hypothetical protein n=1 Tax=Desulfosarcina sp. TaxID=2027861 RepID=UPI0029B75D55|nr:hypothetical protein [Desulfosarcina sp.]MDX2418029.1 hypothetical protein [Xanthomonadales bacterium]MDX2453766.1 hypothetical protein [Desulfosarcina sp.]
MLKKVRNRKNSILIAFAALAFAAFSWTFIGSALSEQEQDLQNKSGFAQAQHLKGKWVRPDGGYRLVIEDVKPDGSLKASYYNPRKINVSISNWKVENERLHLFIELRDTNYPGSTYSLVYAKEQDALDGTYFQAVTKESYSIGFLRIPKGQN